MVANTHCIERTSPKGSAFLGTCRLCSTPGLKLSQANEFCGNPNSLSWEQSLLDAIVRGIRND